MSSKWLHMLLEYTHSETRAPKSTDKTDETHDETPRQEGFVGFVSEFPGACPEKHIDPESVIERSAIMEYDADMDRTRANMAAAQDFDRRRTLVDAPEVVERYRAYIEAWTPDAPGDLPDIPPATVGNRSLWEEWWRKVEGDHHG